jgi:hypothetical protein
MICGICKEREGERLTSYNDLECQCWICQPYRCGPCKELPDIVKYNPLHQLPRRREAVEATRNKS